MFFGSEKHCKRWTNAEVSCFVAFWQLCVLKTAKLEGFRPQIVVLGRPSLRGTVFDRILGPKNGPEDFAVEPSFLCRVCDTWQARRCLQSS